MAKKNAVKVVWDRKGLAEKRGHGYVELAIYLAAGQRKYLSFGSATALEWIRIKNSKEIAEQVAKYEEIVNSMRLLGEEMTVANFEAHIGLVECVNQNTPKVPDAAEAKPKKQSKSVKKPKSVAAPADENVDESLSASFIEFVRDMQTQENVTKATMKHKRVVLRSLETFGRIQTFADLTPAKIMAYDRFLHDGKRTDVTVATYHKNMHYYINILMMEERISRDPYTRVKIKKGESKVRQPLTEDELIKVRDAVITREKLDKVRDLFIFMAYTGLSYIDTQTFDFKKMAVYDEATGMYFIDGKRLKTKTNYFTPILEPAMNVLKKRNFQLPKISNQKANDALHIIEDMLDIKHPMTCHIARHSFATLCLKHGAGMENVSKMLGHTNLKTTARYAKVLQSSIIEHASMLANVIG